MDTARPTPDRTATDEACRAFQPVLEFLGRRWVGIVLLAGQRGARRFSQYRAMVPGISDRLLTQRLRELEQHGLIERTVIPTTPVQILYTPTQRGEGLMDATRPLLAWSLANPPE
ncbi:winged helix-turn-helix transcriptional regulator [Actinospica robiniae]|uniref:winged helix-turn-helix transcriptional regulator n=1 Tax=Actinospica robiniae TaxID=304901 RepID=UPI000684C9C3|nr:helix-turn-helix domain-containing protein [Actinospica robiniae]